MYRSESLIGFQGSPANKQPVNRELDFGDFSKRKEYIDVNQKLVEMLFSKLPDGFFHADVAAGTGMVERLFRENAEKTQKSGTIIGIDPNVTSLNYARKEVPSSEKLSVIFIEGMGQNLKQLLEGKIPQRGVDSVSIHDALHEIRDNSDKASVIQSMADILKPEGYLTYNSAFTTIANNHAPSRWGRWKLLAMKKLGIRERNPDCNSMPILTPQDYKKIIENAKLVVVHEKTTPVFLTKEALEAISRYPAFFRGTFDDIKGQEKVPDAAKSNALIESLNEIELPLPKIWHEIIAQKPAVCPATNPTTIFQSNKS
jgi:ubiquinone/menaquinone biosynthesis C-methylase UbiE